jgi:membrane associated rhomboid family serine protease
VIDLNRLLLFIAVISPLAVLVLAWRRGATYGGWHTAAIVVLLITGIAWIFFRDWAGYVGGGAWFALLFLPTVGLRRVAELTARQRFRSARKLAIALYVLHPSTELRQQIQLLRTLESRQASGSLPPPMHEDVLKNRSRRLRDAPAVLIFILLNVAAFVFEMSAGDWTEPETLHRLGALEPYQVLVRGEYWRLFTALFLHGGAIHLLFNLFALYVLGPPLERAIGTVRFCAAYLISGLGSSAGVVALWKLHLINVTQLIGASGCVMGIVGAWAGFLLRHRHAPKARQRLSNVVMIIVIQTAFDLSTPQVSLSAHLCGLVTGFIVGLALAPRQIA